MVILPISSRGLCLVPHGMVVPTGACTIDFLLNTISKSLKSRIIWRCPIRNTNCRTMGPQDTVATQLPLMNAVEMQMYVEAMDKMDSCLAMKWCYSSKMHGGFDPSTVAQLLECRKHNLLINGGGNILVPTHAEKQWLGCRTSYFQLMLERQLESKGHVRCCMHSKNYSVCVRACVCACVCAFCCNKIMMWLLLLGTRLPMRFDLYINMSSRLQYLSSRHFMMRAMEALIMKHISWTKTNSPLMLTRRTRKAQSPANA